MKEIIIIGNSDVNMDYSQRVDGADFVVRFNDMRNYGGNTGTKVDALCVTNLASPGRAFAKYKKLEHFSSLETLKEIWFPRPSRHLAVQFWFKPLSYNVFGRVDYRKHIITRNNFHQKKIVSFSEELYSACCNELGIDRHSVTFFPSTGYLAIQYALTRFAVPDTTISLIGFSFEGNHCHQWLKERNNVFAIQNQGLISVLDFDYHDKLS
ncbi:MAG: hypothetical protein QG557_1118 [Pseudomonadota bacterium]|nr:hypothetical protein [Pseudomonadota bacterium]